MSEWRLLDSWRDNAARWTRAVRGRLIPSRVKVTDQAVLQAVGEPSGRLLDLGCGEGWLSHLLMEQGWQVVGVDAIPELVESAGGPPNFLCSAYEELGEALAGQLFHTVVANFSLLGDDSSEQAVAAARNLLEPGGRLLIQTLHPVCAFSGRQQDGDASYRDGWRTEDWGGFDQEGERWVPAPWYFRTLEGWVALLSRHGFRLSELREPREANAPLPLSLILLAER